MAINSLLIAAKEFYYYYITRKEKNLDAIKAMLDGLNATRTFLEAPDFSDRNKRLYLANLWSEAANKVSKIDHSLGQLLIDKSRFWGNFEEYVNLKMDKDIISLDSVNDQINLFSNELV